VASQYRFHHFNATELLTKMSPEQRAQHEAAVRAEEEAAQFMHVILRNAGYTGVPAVVTPCGDMFIGPAAAGAENATIVVNSCEVSASGASALRRQFEEQQPAGV
jgi:hypothetical protein